MNNRICLVADENKIWTNGEIYGTEIYLANNLNKEDFYMISLTEYQEKIEQEFNNELV